jgi:hypothetical protein
MRWLEVVGYIAVSRHVSQKENDFFFRGVGVEIGRCCQFFWRFSSVYVDSMSIIGGVMSIMLAILPLSAVHLAAVYGVAAAIPCPYNDRQ